MPENLPPTPVDNHNGLQRNWDRTYPARATRPGRHEYPSGPIVDMGSQVYPALRAYWRILAKRRWTIITVAFIVVTLVAIASFKMKPVFEATSRIEIDSELPQIQSLNDLYRSMPSDDGFLQTQVNVLQSDSLGWKTVEQSGVGSKPEFQRALKGVTGENWLAVRTRLLRLYRHSLQVDQVGDSRMVEIRFESHDPQLAAQVVNALVQNYIKYNFQKNYDATRQASGWMEQRLDELKARVESSQQALVDYERRHAIFDVDGRQTIAGQRLAALTQELAQAEDVRMKEESLYNTINSGSSHLAFAAHDDLLARLEDRYAALEAEYVEALDRYGPKFPKVIWLHDEAGEIQGFVVGERQRNLGEIAVGYQAALRRESLLAQAVARQKAAVGELNELLIEHNLLKEQFQTNQQLYRRLLQHLRDATISAGLKATNVHVVDSALPPIVPVRPRKLLYIGAALFSGLAMGVILAFTEEALDNSISGIEEVEQLTAAPTLAVIPAARLARGREYRARGPGGRRRNLNGAVALSVVCEPDSAVAESYRNLRTSILLSTAPRPPQAILITSTQPLEGKTSTSLNLALALAQRNTRTLIIDADLRKRGIGAALAVRETAGLSGVLTGAQSIDEAVQPADGMAGLWALPAGPRPPNPAELLSSPAMESLLDELRHRFDYLVLDSPPLLPVTDATVLSAFVDGVVLVVECGVTDRGALARAHRMLENAGARVLGTVLNKIEPNHDGYYRSSYRAYYGNKA
jgi:succinoglycan biosynthesis transport protein ExoP